MMGGPMHLLLVSPSRIPGKKITNGFKFSQLTLHVLASLTPPDVEVSAIDEDVADIDFSKSYDLVGITCMTATARRAYQLGDLFRARGTTVVMGGIHPTVLPQEAIAHCDAVVIGEAEGCWGTLIEDLRHGRLQKFYQSEFPDLSSAPLPRRDLGIDHTVFNAVGLETTRGCPYNCEFCSVTDFYGPHIRHRSVANVVEDVKRSGSKLFLITDDNVNGHPAYSKELFRALEPLGITWVGQSSIKLAQDRELLELCRKSGCAALFFGLESVSADGMQSLRKSYHSIEESEEAIRIIQGQGIAFHPSIVLGLDTDTPAIFDDTLEFLHRNRIPTVTVNVMTPYPGTRTYKRLAEKGRLISDDWYYYDHKCVVFQPKHMSPEDLQEGYRHVMKSFYSPAGIARHFGWSLRMTPLIPKRILFLFLWNIAHRTFHAQIDSVLTSPEKAASRGRHPAVLERTPV
ncbi:MAG: radical SAM protein [Spirochaetia bacterium]